MGLKGFNDNLAKLRKLALSGEMKDWAEVDALLAELGVTRVAQLEEVSERARLYEVGSLVPALFALALKDAGIEDDGLANDAAQLLAEVRETYETALPAALQKWYEGKQDAEASSSIQAMSLELDLELPFVNSVTAAVRSESWCTLCKKLRSALKSVTSLAQTVVYRCLALATTSVLELEPLWDVVLERRQAEEADEEMSDGEEEEEEEEEDAAESTDADSDEAEGETAAGVSLAQEVADFDDEVIEVENAEDFYRYLSVLKDEEKVIARKRETLTALKALAPQTEEELDVLHGRKTRAAKMIHQVLSRVRVDDMGESPVEALITVFESIAGPCYGLYAELAKHMANASTRGVAWVKRLKELLSDVNSLCKRLVNLIITKVSESGAQSKRARNGEQLNLCRAAVLSYAMCYQNGLLFYLARAKEPTDEGWLQLATTLKWTADLCDNLWRSKMDQSEATQLLEPGDEEERAIQDEVWASSIVDTVTLHPPNIKCKSCKGKRQAEELRCLAAKSHFESLLTKIILDGHVVKRNSPFRLIKAIQELSLPIPPLVFVQSLLKVSHTRNLSRELIGLMLKA